MRAASVGGAEGEEADADRGGLLATGADDDPDNGGGSATGGGAGAARESRGRADGATRGAEIAGAAAGGTVVGASSNGRVSLTTCRHFGQRALRPAAAAGKTSFAPQPQAT
jgi:succinate dehydrogenase/fumarate reductase flavoprotein subunit